MGNFDSDQFLSIITQILVRLKDIPSAILSEILSGKIWRRKDFFQLTVFAVKIKD